MTSNHVGLVLAVHKSGALKVTGGVLKGLRELRALGLIEHDGSTLAGSGHVRLTALGDDVVGHLRAPSAPSDKHPDLPIALADSVRLDKPLPATSGPDTSNSGKTV